jgi:hypothetical protein
LKKERDENRKKMKEDILNKKKQMQGANGGIKVEFIGVPSTMLDNQEKVQESYKS